MKDKPINKQIVNLVYEKGRGWSFSRKDFVRFGEPDSIDQALSPDVDQVAHALARKFGWKIQISGNAALNLVGLSTQIPTQYLYLSDGPSKTYQLGNTEVTFKKTRFTQLGLKHSYNEILVQAVQVLGTKR